MKKINADTRYLISLWIVLVLAIVLTYAHHGNIIVDCGREVYYPTQILLGKVLYKDIFNIYGPFSYMYNALLFKLFGINLNVLYISGCISAFAIVTLIYLIARKFLSEFISFSIALFTISTGVLNVKLFNFVFPYSYSMLYGLVAFLVSFLFLLKYIENSPKISYFYVSTFFAGLCFANKYEFIPYLFVILYVIFTTKPLKLKEYYYIIFNLLFFPIFSFGVLFLQGLTVNDLILSSSLLKKMAQSQTLKYMYQHTGVFFHKETPKLLISKFIETSVPVILLLFSSGKKKIISIPLNIVAIFLILRFFGVSSFVFLPLFITIWFVLDFKTIRKNRPLTILLISAIAISFKNFCGLLIFGYGNFILSFLLVAIVALISEKFKDKKSFLSLAGFYFIFVSVILAIPSFYDLTEKSYVLTTKRGKVYTEKEYYESTNELVNYISKYTKKSDTIIILPEGSLVNFLSDRRSDNYYNSLIPLYWEVFGDDKLIEHFNNTKPEYIILNNWDSSKDYYLGTICNDYAFKFCSYIAKNYKLQKIIDKNFRYLIYKK